MLHSHISSEDPIDEVLLWKVEGALELIIVERDFSRTGTVKSSLRKRGPCVLEQESAADVVLTDTCHPRVHRLSTVMFDGVFPQEEEGEESDIISRDELRL